MGKRTITSVLVSDVEKRRFPEKHYVYVISVRWSDGTNRIVYRRYSQFFNLQTELIELFPKESGKNDPEERIIPFLPGKILFGRSNVRDVALKRQPSIDEYCQKLVNLPSRISECDDVIDFFDITDEDIHPPSASDNRRPSANLITDPLQVEHYEAIADYTKVTGREVSLVAGMAVDVIEKNESGWWLVSVEEEQGWVPSTYLERVDGKEDDHTVHSIPGDETSYICSEDYVAASDDEISLDRGACVEVLRKKLDGWWWVSYKDKAGWAPATYLAKLEPERAEHFAEAEAPANYPVQIVRNLFDVTTLAISTPEAGDAGAAKSDVSADVNVNVKSDVIEEPKAQIDVELRPGKEERKQRLSNASNPRFSSQPPRRNTINRKIPPKRPDPPKVKKEYYTLADFTDHAEDGLSFVEGQQVKIVEKNTSGWWYVEIEGNTGWVPASYIQEKSIPLGKLASTAEEGSERPRRVSRQGLGVPPPPPLPEIQVALPEIEEPVKEPKEDNNNQSKMPNFGLKFPKFGGLKKTTEEKEPGLVQKIFGKEKNADSTKDDDESRVSHFSSALKNVLKPKGTAKSVQIVDPTEPDCPVPQPEFSSIYEEIPDVAGEMYQAIADYVSADESEIGLTEGQAVTVLEMTDTGWWLVRVDGAEGWTPASYLEEVGNQIYEEVDDFPNMAAEGDVAMGSSVANDDAVAREKESAPSVDLASQLSKMMAARRASENVESADLREYGSVWSPDDVEKEEPTEIYDVVWATSKPSASQNETPSGTADASGNENEAPTNAFAEARKRLSAVPTSTESTKPKFEPKKFDKPKPEPNKFDKPKLEPKKFDNPKPEPNKFDKPKLEPKKFDKPKPEPNKFDKPKLEPKKFDKPKPTTAKPVLNQTSVNKFLDKSSSPSSSDTEVSELTQARKRLTSVLPKEEQPVSVKPVLNRTTVNKFLDRSSSPSSSDTEVNELTQARKRLTSLLPKGDLKISDASSRSTNQTSEGNCAAKSSVSEKNKARESILARAKMFSVVTPGDERPKTPPKPGTVAGLRRGSGGSPNTSRPSTPPKPGKLPRERTGELSGAFHALKSQKPDLGAKPTTTASKPTPKPKISDLASKFDKPDLQKKEGPPRIVNKGNNGTQNTELAAVLNKRRTHVDS